MCEKHGAEKRPTRKQPISQSQKRDECENEETKERSDATHAQHESKKVGHVWVCSYEGCNRLTIVQGLCKFHKLLPTSPSVESKAHAKLFESIAKSSDPDSLMLV